jgi:leucyl aminopeptidase
MEFSIKPLSPETAKTGCIVLGVHANQELTPAARRADQAAKGALRKALADLPAKAGATLLLRSVPGLAAERVLLVSLGERGEFGESAYRDAVRGAGNALKDLGAKDAALFLVDGKIGSRHVSWNLRHAVLGLREAFYRFDQMKSQKKPAASALQEVFLPLSSNSLLKQTLAEAAATADGIDLAKTLGNLPPNICTPAYLADEAKKLARQYKLQVEVLERADMQKLGMGALLAVAHASHNPPKLIVLRYNGAAKGKKPIALVGKGITFDTGGISLKPAAEMDEMKFDMSGAGSVLGALRALAGMKAPVNVVGVIPTCENMPGGKAIRPGDVLIGASGKTVEIINTDAEGRLILGDALWYAQQLGATHLVDVATLTGACTVALGKSTSGLFGTPAEWVETTRAAATRAGDRVWPLPIDGDYRELLRSEIADLINSAGRAAGAITAACFLREFVDDRPWAHLDIAGTAWQEDRKPYQQKGATGVAVRALVELAAST